MTRRPMQLARLAIAIRAAAASDVARPFSAELPRGTWQRCEDLARQVSRARQRGWNLAAAAREGDLRYALARIHAELEELDRQLAPATGYTRIASATDIHRDLSVLGDEFRDWSCDRARKRSQ